MTPIYQISADDLRAIIREEVERAVCRQAMQQPVDADASGQLMTWQVGSRSVRYRRVEVYKLGVALIK